MADDAVGSQAEGHCGEEALPVGDDGEFHVCLKVLGEDKIEHPISHRRLSL